MNIISRRLGHDNDTEVAYSVQSIFVGGFEEIFRSSTTLALCSSNLAYAFHLLCDLAACIRAAGRESGIKRNGIEKPEAVLRKKAEIGVGAHLSILRDDDDSSPWVNPTFPNQSYDRAFPAYRLAHSRQPAGRFDVTSDLDIVWALVNEECRARYDCSV